MYRRRMITFKCTHLALNFVPLVLIPSIFTKSVRGPHTILRNRGGKQGGPNNNNSEDENANKKKRSKCSSCCFYFLGLN